MRGQGRSGRHRNDPVTQRRICQRVQQKATTYDHPRENTAISTLDPRNKTAVSAAPSDDLPPNAAQPQHAGPKRANAQKPASKGPQLLTRDIRSLGTIQFEPLLSKSNGTCQRGRTPVQYGTPTANDQSFFGGLLVDVITYALLLFDSSKTPHYVHPGPTDARQSKAAALHARAQAP